MCVCVTSNTHGRRGTRTHGHKDRYSTHSSVESVLVWAAQTRKELWNRFGSSLVQMCSTCIGMKMNRSLTCILAVKSEETLILISRVLGFFSIQEKVNFYTRYHYISSYIMLLSSYIIVYHLQYHDIVSRRHMIYMIYMI